MFIRTYIRVVLCQHILDNCRQHLWGQVKYARFPHWSLDKKIPPAGGHVARAGYGRSKNGRRNAPRVLASSVASLARWTPARESKWASVVRVVDLHQAGHFVQSTLSARNSTTLTSRRYLMENRRAARGRNPSTAGGGPRSPRRSLLPCVCT